MRIEEVEPDRLSASFEGEPVFRVRLWTPATNGAAWLVDEWHVFECADVRDVIAWAESQAATTFEVAVRWPYWAQNALGETVTRHRYTLIAGCPGDESSGTHQEFFTREP